MDRPRSEGTRPQCRGSPTPAAWHFPTVSRPSSRGGGPLGVISTVPRRDITVATGVTSSVCSGTTRSSGSAPGRWHHAVLSLLSRLGLRAGEVAAMV
jgi:hypothetical protein